MTTIDLDLLVQHYQDHYKPDADREKRFYQKFSTLDENIWHSALARTSDDKRNPHQRRLSQSVLEHVAIRLLSQKKDISTIKKDILPTKQFDTLLQMIRHSAVRGFGELAVYDTAERIGAWLGIQPQYVYLHAGTLTGARNLDINVSSVYLTISDLPAPLRGMKASDIENFLCIYKKSFLSGEMPSIRSKCTPGQSIRRRLSC